MLQSSKKLLELHKKRSSIKEIAQNFAAMRESREKSLQKLGMRASVENRESRHERSISMFSREHLSQVKLNRELSIAMNDAVKNVIETSPFASFMGRSSEIKQASPLLKKAFEVSLKPMARIEVDITEK